jgi:HlyD family secretion protein
MKQISLRQGIGLGVMAIATLLGVKIIESMTADTASPPAAVMTVSVVQPKNTRMVTTLNLTGQTTPREEILLFSELNGARVKELFVEPGITVSKGQVLAVLDTTTSANTLAQLNSQMLQARDAYQRVEAISNTGAVSKESVIQKRQAMLAAQAQVAEAQANQRRTTIVAPADGLVFERKAVLGDIPSSNIPLFRLAKEGIVEVLVSVPEADLGSVQVGQSATITLTGNPIPLSGWVRMITPQIDAATRTAPVRVEFETSATTAVGLFAQLELMQGEREGLMLPSTAILQDTLGTYVFAVNKNNQLLRRDISITASQGPQSLVSGVSSTDNIVARAGAFLKVGDKVTTIQATDAAP